MDLLRRCIESGEVVPSKHFREELAADNLTMQEALTIVRSGAIYYPAEPDIRTGDGNIASKGASRTGSGLPSCSASGQENARL